MNRLTPAVKYILIINIALFALKYFGQNVIDLDSLLSLHNPKSSLFQPFQFITHIFMHADFFHIAFNMYALFLFGTILEKVWGPKRFVTYFLITGLGAAALHLFVNWFMLKDYFELSEQFLVAPTKENFRLLITDYAKYVQIFAEYTSDGKTMVYQPEYIVNNWDQFDVNTLRAEIDATSSIIMNASMRGASGAVFGLLLAFGMMFPNVPLMLLFIPVPIKAKYFVIGYGVIELVLGFSNLPHDNIAHFAHLGGMLFGFILLRIWYKGNYNQQR